MQTSNGSKSEIPVKTRRHIRLGTASEAEGLSVSFQNADFKSPWF